MHRFYFDLRDGDSLAVDDEGTELPDRKTAQEDAARSLAAMARNVIQAKAANALCRATAIEVRDDGGPVLQAKLIFEMQLLKQ
jgi:hypothetical protein